MSEFKTLNMDDIRLKFLLNLSVPIEGIGEFKAPLLSEIVNLTENIYNQSLSSILFTKNSLEYNEEMEKHSDFEILLSAVNFDDSFRELFFYGINLHLNKEPVLHESGLIYFDDLSEENILTEEKFNYFKSMVIVANNLQSPKEEEEYKAGNERAAKFMERLKKNKEMVAKAKAKQQPPINLHSLISAVGWKAKSFDFINQLNIYQLYDGYFRLGVLDNYHYTMQGIYSGTVDGSKIKLPEINWANVIKIN